MTAYENSVDDGAGSDHEGAFVDGVANTYERIAAVHGGRPLTKEGNTIELTRFDDIVDGHQASRRPLDRSRRRRRSCRWRSARAGR